MICAIRVADLGAMSHACVGMLCEGKCLHPAEEHAHASVGHGTRKTDDPSSELRKLFVRDALVGFRRVGVLAHHLRPCKWRMVGEYTRVHQPYIFVFLFMHQIRGI